MKFFDFILSLGALVSLLGASYFFATDSRANKTIDEFTKDKVSLIKKIPQFSDSTNFSKENLNRSGEPSKQKNTLESPSTTSFTPSATSKQTESSAPQNKEVTTNSLENPVAIQKTVVKWNYIIIHHSSTKRGNAKIFDRYHRVEKKIPEGLIYHFVIGNGTDSGNGEIEISERWHKKIPAPHTFDPKMNEQSIAICLVGDFNKGKPTQSQIRALLELIQELQQDFHIPTDHILGHNEVDRTKTNCPGKHFPMAELKLQLNRTFSKNLATNR